MKYLMMLQALKSVFGLWRSLLSMLCWVLVCWLLFWSKNYTDLQCVSPCCFVLVCSFSDSAICLFILCTLIDMGPIYELLVVYSVLNDVICLWTLVPPELRHCDGFPSDLLMAFCAILGAYFLIILNE